MNNAMYVVIGEDKETGETWICEDCNFDFENPIQIMTKEQAEKFIKYFDGISEYSYRIAKLSWLD